LIIHIDEAERKIGLSLKGLEKKTEDDETKKYLTVQEAPATSLGEILETKATSPEKEIRETTETEVPDEKGTPIQEEPHAEAAPSENLTEAKPTSEE